MQDDAVRDGQRPLAKVSKINAIRGRQRLHNPGS
jgi:hypothetical protein